ncbi:conjugal transfer protein TraG N-terminal domain-containing protein [Conservatibacter flavescens]|uniref:Conjugal transfer protein TraG n=1 Tax=Conservatibacter flavescens TaxID=28161 RepID=A0A2M8S133_9PAST|nr:conjugal transfer protein TraG N-terminal domain-containing protein [Conservatibacter flavescens]PJG84814.1 conjugal transfer protein TraG [Conservatibacter flavescens]
MTFNVDSYLEYFLTLLGWIINNGLFGLLVNTGLFIAPLIAVLFKTWLDVKKQGADEGNKGDLLIEWLGIQFFPAMFIIVLTLAPMLPISLSNLEYNVDRSKQCGYKVPLSPQQSGYSNIVSEFADKQARVPLLWGLVHGINKGIMHGATSTIPCKFDLRQVRFEIQHEKINNPALLTEVRQFVQQCYLPSRRKLQESQVSMNAAQAREVSWLGGKILLTNSELYPRYRAMQPMQRWPYDKNRDEGLPNTGDGGFPRCDQWWADNNVGLKNMLLADMRQNLSAKLGSLFVQENMQDEVLLRTLLRPENVDVSRGKVYSGYGGNLDPTFSNAANKLVSSAGVLVSKAAVYPGLDAMRTALPMVQSLLIMAVIIIIPIVTVFSGYSLKSIITLMFVQFALVTTSFWWELARWLDSSLIDILYDSSGHSASFAHFLDNAEDDMILNFIMGVMFLVFPTVWIGSMSWAGFSLGELASHFNKGSQQVQQSGGAVGKEIQQKITNKMK